MGFFDGSAEGLTSAIDDIRHSLAKKLKSKDRGDPR
jgi:hypothetical protein